MTLAKIKAKRKMEKMKSKLKEKSMKKKVVVKTSTISDRELMLENKKLKLQKKLIAENLKLKEDIKKLTCEGVGKFSDKDVETILNDYLETLLVLNDEEPEFEDLTIYSVDEKSKAKLKTEIEEFLSKADDYLGSSDDIGNIGSYFFIDRYGYGDGFTDMEYDYERGSELAKIASSFKESSFDVDEGILYIY